MSEDATKRKLFSMIENGDITAEEGLRLLDAIDRGSKDSENEVHDQTISDAEVLESTGGQESDGQPLKIPAEELKRIKNLKRWWWLPFSVGLVLTVISAIWMYLGYSAKGFGWGFWLSWFPFIIGIVIMALSAMTSRMKWLHVKVHENKGKHKANINISLPVPFGILRWFFHNFGDKIPEVKGLPLDVLFADFDHNINSDNPLYVKVDDEGDDVEVFIG